MRGGGKKRVPEWLNSSLWSSTPTTLPKPHPPSSYNPPDNDHDHSDNDNHHHHHPSSSSSKHTVSSSHGPQPQPPIQHDPLSSITITTSISAYDPDNNNTTANSNSNSNSNSNDADICGQALLSQQLSRKVIDMSEVRKLASQGIPDGAGIRSTVWKLLLGYLPADRSLWPSELAKKRAQYAHFKDELLMNPDVTERLNNVSSTVGNLTVSTHVEHPRSGEVARRLEKSESLENDESKCETRAVLPRAEITHDEHPLSLGKSSIWNQFFQDTEIIEQIDRDVMRTHPDMHFFSGDSQFAKSNQDALRNILIVFAKLNPGIRYVQGMNEILAPLFYVFRNDPSEDNAISAEADTFFCFVELLSGFRDHFCQQLDNSVVGIRSTISKLSRFLKENDEELWRHLEVTTKVNPQFYAFRWITLLLTQEFNFADSLLIWDTLISDPEGPQDTLLRICCAMLVLVRRRLLAGDFTANLKLLQHYPPTNISHLLYVANKLRGQLPR